MKHNLLPPPPPSQLALACRCMVALQVGGGLRSESVKAGQPLQGLTHLCVVAQVKREPELKRDTREREENLEGHTLR